MQAGIKGVESGTSAVCAVNLIVNNLVLPVSLLYAHFRPTGKGFLTLSLPDYTVAAIHRLESLQMSGSYLYGEPIYNIWSPRVRGMAMLGDGPSAGLDAGTTVSMSGFPGRTAISDIYKLVKGFDVKKITFVPL